MDSSSKPGCSSRSSRTRSAKSKAAGSSPEVKGQIYEQSLDGRVSTRHNPAPSAPVTNKSQTPPPPAPPLVFGSKSKVTPTSPNFKKGSPTRTSPVRGKKSLPPNKSPSSAAGSDFDTTETLDKSSDDDLHSPMKFEKQIMPPPPSPQVTSKGRPPPWRQRQASSSSSNTASAVPEGSLNPILPLDEEDSLSTAKSAATRRARTRLPSLNSMKEGDEVMSGLRRDSRRRIGLGDDEFPAIPPGTLSTSDKGAKDISDDSDDEWEESLVYVDLDDIPSVDELFAIHPNEFLTCQTKRARDTPKPPKPSYKKVALDFYNLESEQPLLRIGNRCYLGHYEEPFGTFLFFQDASRQEVNLTEPKRKRKRSMSEPSPSTSTSKKDPPPYESHLAGVKPTMAVKLNKLTTDYHPKPNALFGQKIEGANNPFQLVAKAHKVLRMRAVTSVTLPPLPTADEEEEHSKDNGQDAFLPDYRLNDINWNTEENPKSYDYRELLKRIKRRPPKRVEPHYYSLLPRPGAPKHVRKPKVSETETIGPGMGLDRFDLSESESSVPIHSFEKIKTDYQVLEPEVESNLGSIVVPAPVPDEVEEYQEIEVEDPKVFHFQ